MLLTCIAGEGRPVTLDDVARARTTRALTWGRDNHYDVISALHQEHPRREPRCPPALDGRVIVAGEDPRHIARLVVLACLTSWPAPGTTSPPSTARRPMSSVGCTATVPANAGEGVGLDLSHR